MDHEKLQVALEETGVPQHLVILMCDLDHAQEAAVRTENGDRKQFPIGKAVRQGGILSPSLFNLYTKHL